MFPDADTDRTTDRTWPRHLLIVFFAVGIVFFQTLQFDFIWDDIVFIKNNELVHSLSNLPRILHSGDSEGAIGANGYYRPLTSATFALDYAVWGDAPGGYHATNVAFHLAVCAALLALTRRLSPNPIAALVATTAFAVHPAVVEPVSYISARADLLCTLFILMAATMALRHRRTGNRSDRWISVVAFFAALCSKEVAIIYPLFHGAWSLLAGRRTFRDSVLDALPYGVAAVSFLVLRDAILPSATLGGSHHLWGGAFTLAQRTAVAGPVILSYLRLVIFPWGVEAFHGVWPTSFTNISVVASWVALAVVGTGVMLLGYRRRFPEAFGIAWIVAALLPVSGVVYLLYPLMADRYLYLPLVGGAVALASSLSRVISSATVWTPMVRNTLEFAVVGALALWMGLSFSHTEVYRDRVSYWSEASRNAPDHPFVVNAFASTLRNVGELELAEKHAQRALSIDSSYPPNHILMSSIALDRGDVEKAAFHTMTALQLAPNDSRTISNSGHFFWATGRIDEALFAFRQTLAMSPYDVDTKACIDEILESRAGKD